MLGSRTITRWMILRKYSIFICKFGGQKNMIRALYQIIKIVVLRIAFNIPVYCILINTVGTVINI